MDRTVKKEPQPHLPMTAGPQHGSLGQSSGLPQYEEVFQGDNAGNARSGSCGNAYGSKHLQRMFGCVILSPITMKHPRGSHSLSNNRPSNLYRRAIDKPGPNTWAAHRGTQTSEPEYEDIPLVTMTRRAHADQSEPARPATAKRSTTDQARQDSQQGGPQPQGRQAQSLPRGRVDRATQAGPDGGEDSEFAFRGGDTGNCVKEPCGCCAYWINKICCGDN
ncbi:hypothetical protein F4814DRAFT_428015 [Daldinia grandis]|nr:hypothetical protein F4814DRAFT_428015 [Daldinia grandis]